MNKSFEDLVEIVRELSQKDEKDISQKGLKLFEETGEVAEALLSYNKASSCAYKEKSLDDLTEELGDTLNCVLDVAIASGIEPRKVVEVAIEKCLYKWKPNIERETKKYKDKE